MLSSEQYFYKNTQNIRDIGTVKHGPAQVDNFIGSDLENFSWVETAEFSKSKGVFVIGHASTLYCSIGNIDLLVILTRFLMKHPIFAKHCIKRSCVYYFYMYVSADCVAYKWRYPPFVTLILNKIEWLIIIL